MSRLPRPHIPYSVRLQVADRQCLAAYQHIFRALFRRSAKEHLATDLYALFGEQPSHLDHDPPLGAREKIWKDGKIVGYVPAANDPEYLVYRLKVDHQVKTNIRGEHGQHPDRVLIKRQRRRDREATKKRSRPLRSGNRWPPKGSRKISNRRR